jgi:sortase (surface protein transpeptidase)
MSPRRTSTPPPRRAGASSGRSAARAPCRGPSGSEIPAIGVRAPVVPLELNRDRTLEIPARFGDTGWWTGGARPGERGPAVVAGHVDSHTGPAVFYRLSQLRAGDTVVVVRRGGSRVRFVVVRTERYAKARFPTTRVYGRTRAPALRLITCSGPFDRATGHYLDNTVVYARRG